MRTLLAALGVLAVMGFLNTASAQPTKPRGESVSRLQRTFASSVTGRSRPGTRSTSDTESPIGSGSGVGRKRPPRERLVQ